MHANNGSSNKQLIPTCDICLSFFFVCLEFTFSFVPFLLLIVVCCKIGLLLLFSVFVLFLHFLIVVILSFAVAGGRWWRCWCLSSGIPLSVLFAALGKQVYFRVSVCHMGDSGCFSIFWWAHLFALVLVHSLAPALIRFDFLCECDSF